MNETSLLWEPLRARDVCDRPRRARTERRSVTSPASSPKPSPSSASVRSTYERETSSLSSPQILILQSQRFERRYAMAWDREALSARGFR
jgi:hypothetical protein